jgi:CheY-like chemotaxis protein
MGCHRVLAPPPPRLMIVEENQRLRDAIVRLVADRAPGSVLAPDGTAVIRRLTHAFEEHRGADVDVVVVDVDSAGRSGLDILATARERHWPVRVVLTSAVAGPSLRADVLRLGAVALLPRPLTEGGWRSLLRTVATV